MKKNIFLLIAFFTLTPSLFAQAKTELLLRFSKQENLIRIVFEATDESFIKETNVVISPSMIKMEFPESFKLTTPKDFPFVTFPQDKSLVINLKKEGKVKILRLFSPPRLVLEIKTVERHLLPWVVVLDAGHGGYDSGIIAKDTKEKDITLSLAKELNAALSKKVKSVFLTRNADHYMSLTDRINFVNKKRPDAFISLHLSTTRNFVLHLPLIKDTNEVVDLYRVSSVQKRYIGKSKDLSDSLGKAIKEEFNADVNLREMPLPLLNSSGAPSVLIELPSPEFVVYDEGLEQDW